VSSSVDNKSTKDDDNARGSGNVPR